MKKNNALHTFSFWSVSTICVRGNRNIYFLENEYSIFQTVFFCKRVRNNKTIEIRNRISHNQNKVLSHWIPKAISTHEINIPSVKVVLFEPKLFTHLFHVASDYQAKWMELKLFWLFKLILPSMKYLRINIDVDKIFTIGFWL